MVDQDPANGVTLRYDIDDADPPVHIELVKQRVKTVSMGLTDRRKTAKNLVDSRKKCGSVAPYAR